MSKVVKMLKYFAKRTYVKRLLLDDRKRRAHLMAEFEGLGPALWDYTINDKGELDLQGIDLMGLARKFGTPLHVVDRCRLVANYEEFVGAFRRVLPKVELGTSYKTNLLPGVLSVLHESGSWAEVISHFELWLAFQLGVPPERIIVNGPGKGRECIKLAVDRGVRLVNIDGREEIPWIVEAAQKTGRRQDVGLRVVTSVGWTGQFGARICSGEALETFKELMAYPEINACGLHMHLGTGIKNVSTYLRAITDVLEFANRLRTELGIKITIYDFGGGYGVPTVRSLSAWDLRMQDMGFHSRMALPDDCPSAEEYARGIKPILKRFHKGFDKDPPLVILEPGRAITSSAQCLLLSVVTVKRSKESRTRLILDGGKNITMPLGWETHQIFPVEKMLAKNVELFDLYGPLCHPADIIDRCKSLPQMEIGDVLAIMDAGAYFIPNQMNFSHPRPSVVMVDKGRVQEIRKRESFCDIVRLDPLVSEGCCNYQQITSEH